MLEKVKEIARTVLAEKQADGVLGLMKGQWDIIQPHIFESPVEVDALVIEPKWLLAKMAMTVLRSSREGYRLAVVVRGCDERALTELVKRNQIEKERLVTIGIACTAEQAQACICDRPYPQKLDCGDAVAGVDPFSIESVKELLAGDGPARMEKWANILKRCIKCYGCRNSCPICVCVTLQTGRPGLGGNRRHTCGGAFVPPDTGVSSVGYMRGLRGHVRRPAR